MAGDWLSLEKSPPIPKPQVTGWSHLLGVARVADMARRLGKSDDAKMYSARLVNLTQAYRNAYQKADGSYGSWQTANVLALYLNLTRGAETATTTAALVADLGKHGNRTLSGLVGVSYIFQALVRAGRHELALSIASAVDEPSWGYMVRMRPCLPTSPHTSPHPTLPRAHGPRGMPCTPHPKYTSTHHVRPRRHMAGTHGPRNDLGDLGRLVQLAQPPNVHRLHW